MTDDAGNQSSETVSLKMEEVFPDLSILLPEVNVFGGAELQLTTMQLFIGSAVVAEWSDKYTQQCKVALSFGGREVNSGDVLSEPGKLVLTVTNNQGRNSTAEITLVNGAVVGEARIGEMQVDEETDLLADITFAEGATLVKTEIEQDGQRTEIADPHSFTPEYPGSYTLIFTVKGKNGDTAEVRVDNLSIKPLDYQVIIIKNADMINEKYPWYNNLQQATKDFIYPHLIASYAACNQFKHNNRVHIIM